jgi:capsular polysaccharide export protein
LRSKYFASYLFLQGPASGFFSRLAGELRRRGHAAGRINFNGGDRVFWRHDGAVDYLGDEARWPDFLTTYLAINAVTDIVLLGDCRPLHKAAIALARANGIKTHIFEEGYIRPDFITLEHGGVNGFSALPRKIEAYVTAASLLDEQPAPCRVKSNFSRRAFDDVAYSTCTLLMSWRFRNYRRHWPYGQVAEYVNGGRRMFARMLRGAARQREISRLIETGADYYVFPMQVDVDSQIRYHSQFTDQREVIRLVVESFAMNAPRQASLVITEHPLETSPVDWHSLVKAQAAVFGVADRVRFLIGGSPDELLLASRGVVVINSTTGHRTLELGVPLIALSQAVFNLAPLTFQGGLDRFWTEAAPADPMLIQAYRRVVIAYTQLNGGFFSDEGITLAVVNAAARMEEVSRCQLVRPELDELAATWLGAESSVAVKS